MEKDELEKLRKERLEELQNQLSNEENDEMQQQQEEARKAYELKKQALLRKILSDKAKQRLNNIKLVKPQMAENIEDQLIQLAQSGRISGRISEKQLLKLLKQIRNSKRDSNITFKRV